MEIRYSKDVQKTIKGMDKATKDRIRVAILKLTLEPPEGNIKPMEGVKYAGCYRVRVGQYRIIYHYANDGEVTILYIDKVGSRGDVYK